MPRSTSGRYRKLLRHHDYRLLVVSTLIDDAGSWGYFVVLAVYVFDRTHSTEWLAAVPASRWVTGLIVGPYAGVLADRFERTRVMLVSSTSSAVVMAAMTVAVGVDGPPGLLVALAALAAAVAAPYPLAAIALTPQLVGEDQLATANALESAIGSLVIVVGPAIGGLLLLTGTPVVAIAINAASFVVAAAMTTRLRIHAADLTATQDEEQTSFRQGLRVVLSERSTSLIMLYGGLTSAIYAASTVVYEPMSHQFGSGSNGYTYLIAASAAGSVIAAPIAERLSRRLQLAAIIVASIGLQAVPFLVSIWVHNAVLGTALQLVGGFGLVVIQVLSITAVQRSLPIAMLSRAMAVFDVLILASIVVSSYITAGLLSATSLHTTLALIGIGFPVAALLGAPALRAADRRAAAAAAELRPRVDLLETLDLFDGIERTALERLAAAVEPKDVPVGTEIIRYGEPADALWVLVDGLLSVTVPVPATQSENLPDVTAPGVVGELGLLHRIPRTATVAAKLASTLWRIPAENFLAVLESAPASTSLLSLAGTRMARTPGAAGT